MKTRAWALTEIGCNRVGEGVLVTVFCIVSAAIPKEGLFHIVCNCAGDPVATILVFACCKD